MKWTVTFDGVPMNLTTVRGADKLTFIIVENGSYAYTIAANTGWEQSSVPYAGSENVSGSALAVSLNYVKVYTVNFHETGLPAGTPWSVLLGASTRSSTTSKIAFSESNGTFLYMVANISGYHISLGSYSGSVAVKGAAVTVLEKFAQMTYTITFTEGGLPPGTLWSVRIGSLRLSATSTSINFTKPNGSYAYAVPTVPGWHINSGSSQRDSPGRWCLDHHPRDLPPVAVHG